MPNLDFHDDYLTNLPDWTVYRDILEGGRRFATKYLEPYPGEEPNDYNKRLKLSTTGGFAAAKVMEIRNSIFSRLDAIRRTGGGDDYQLAVAGRSGGVDLRNKDMTFFMGMDVLLELLFLGKVGVFTDHQALDDVLPRTLASTLHDRPYVYTYIAEDIVNWSPFVRDNQLQWEFLVLRVRKEPLNPAGQVPTDGIVQYREFLQDGERVLVRTWAEDRRTILVDWTELEIDRIPFAVSEMERPLLKDAAQREIALMNIESADINFLWRGNTIQYVEEQDLYIGQRDLLGTENINERLDEDDVATQDKTVGGDNPQVVKHGVNQGRAIAKGLKYPQFIAPPTGPTETSMLKQSQLKQDICELLNLSVASARSKFSSAESKEQDSQGLFSGLSAIGLMMEQLEREVGVIWGLYDPAAPAISVNYPQRYSNRSDDDRRKDAQALLEMSNAVAAPLARKSAQVEAFEGLFAGKMSDEDLDAMLAEIRETEWPTADPKQIREDIEIGVLSRSGGSIARGYPAKEAEKAEAERETRDAATAMSQGVNLGARGVVDDPEAAAQEKKDAQDPENNPDGIRQVRGEAR